MDAEADLHGAGRDLEIVGEVGRQRAGLERHAHAAHRGHRLAADAGDLGQGPAAGGGGTADLEEENAAGDAAPVLGALGRGRGHVVGAEHGLDADAVGRGQLGCHVEVHHVAGIVAVEEEHAVRAGGGLGGGEDRLGRGRGEDVADDGGGGEASPT